MTSSSTAILSGKCQEAFTSNPDETKEYFWGCYPSIAANSSGDLVCVYNHYPQRLLLGTIHYAVGNMRGYVGLQWNSQRHISAGDYPRVAINEDKTVVLVFTVSGKIKYRIGIMTQSCNSISWNNEYDITAGQYPSIAMSGTTVLLVFQVGKQCRWCLGELDNATYIITWKSDFEQALAENVEYPCVSIKDNLVTAFYCKSAEGLIISKVGEMNSDTMEWADPQEPSNLKGKFPCIAMFDKGRVIAIFQRGDNLIFRHGTVNVSDKTVEWEEREHSLQGRYPSVAAVKSCEDKGQIFVEMHCNHFLNSRAKCYYNISRIAT